MGGRWEWSHKLVQCRFLDGKAADYVFSQELLSGDISYSNKPDLRVPSAILKGELPTKPNNDRRFELFDQLWSVCQAYWIQVPNERPIV